jgi:hypothetical protein
VWRSSGVGSSNGAIGVYGRALTDGDYLEGAAYRVGELGEHGGGGVLSFGGKESAQCFWGSANPTRELGLAEVRPHARGIECSNNLVRRVDFGACLAIETVVLWIFSGLGQVTLEESLTPLSHV